MTRSLAVFKRICLEMFRDKRTLALMILAPIVLLSLIWEIGRAHV